MDSKIQKNIPDIVSRIEELKRKAERMRDLLSQVPANAEERLTWLNDQLQ
jgi:hypothetical protein